MLLAIAAAVPTRAEDVSDAAAPALMAPALIWQGFYAGGFGGKEFVRGHILSPTQSTRTSYDQSFAGLYGGYNWQSGALVLGIEGDWARSPFNVGDGLFTLRGRAGLAFENVLVYATAGVGSQSWALVRIFTREVIEQEYFGWVAGGGVEIKFSDSISSKLEVLYFDAGQERYNFPAGASYGPVSATYDVENILYRAGVSYHFN
jgi:outer membrane immunogenic protein